ncbi:TPM domain-containing protein [Nibribacter ruber]|uniref:TPM domain-containing protein n=1 Tax=Nibribacter ruber TaxID=2698458 RepID=A0A6P1P1Y9_9BACT|nr:TPM domain-containing protein [Nibribacter ruber]QHL88112.1 TPM domain-containing protein [Nibribacter ruber]
MPRDIITPADEAALVAAIEEAERNTSGEIRVHFENTCEINVLDRAAQVFAELHMHETKLRNGVLFYVALRSHKFAVLGDGGINAVVPANFWEDITQQVIQDFKQEKYAEGLAKGIRLAGEQLKSYFPYAGAHKDVNELSDSISFGTPKEDPSA